MKQTDSNPDMNLKINNQLKIFFFISLLLFASTLSYNLIFKPVDLKIIVETERKNNLPTYYIKVIQLNELNFRVPFDIERVDAKLLQGENILKINYLNSSTIELIPFDANQEGFVSILFSIDKRNIHKTIEIFISTPKA